MDASDYQSDGECSFYDFVHELGIIKMGKKVKLMKDPGTWVACNPDHLLNVTTLKLELPDDVDTLSDSIADFLNLDCLIINSGFNLKCLPRILTTLPKLTKLQLYNCPNLSEFPSNFGNLFTLRYIILRNCGINSLPQCFSQLELNHLELINCVFIQELPPSLHVGTLLLEGCHVKCFSGKPRCLEVLEINNCLYLEDILTSLYGLDILHKLRIKGYDRECLSKSLSGIRNLIMLEVSHCMNLKRLPENVGNYADLYALNLTNCGIECIPLELRNLNDLIIWNCPLEFHVIKEFVSLRHLDIISCCVKSLHGCLTGLTNLERLTIEDCVALEDLPTDINTLVNLQELIIEGCVSLNELPLDLDGLTNLLKLDLSYTNIQSLPCTVTKLTKLKHINLPVCFRLETLPNDLDLNKAIIYLPLSFRLDTLPTKFSVTNDMFWYQLHLKTASSEEENVAGNTEAQSDSNIDARNHAFENEQLGIMTSGSEVRLEPLDHSDVQNVPVKSKRRRGEVTLEDIRQCFSRNMTLVNAAEELEVSRSTMKRRLKDLDIEWPSSRKGIRNHSSKKKNHNTKSTFVSESLERSTVDRSECSDVANRLMLPDCALGDAAINQLCSVDFGTNIIGETSGCISPHTVDDGHTVAFTLASQGGTHHLLQESEGAPSVKHNKTNKSLFKELIKSLMDEGINQEAVAEMLNVYQDNRGCMGTSSVEAEDGRTGIIVVKAEYKEHLLRFDFLSTSSVAKLKEEVMKRLPLQEDRMMIKYQDEDKDWVLLACSDDLQHCLRLSVSSESKIIRLMIVDS